MNIKDFIIIIAVSLAVFFLFSLPSFAGQFQVTVIGDLPTTRENGDDFSCVDIDKVKLYQIRNEDKIFVGDLTFDCSTNKINYVDTYKMLPLEVGSPKGELFFCATVTEKFGDQTLESPCSHPASVLYDIKIPSPNISVEIKVVIGQ